MGLYTIYTISFESCVHERQIKQVCSLSNQVKRLFIICNTLRNRAEHIFACLESYLSDKHVKGKTRTNLRGRWSPTNTGNHIFLCNEIKQVTNETIK